MIGGFLAAKEQPEKGVILSYWLFTKGTEPFSLRFRQPDGDAEHEGPALVVVVVSILEEV